MQPPGNAFVLHVGEVTPNETARVIVIVDPLLRGLGVAEAYVVLLVELVVVVVVDSSLSVDSPRFGYLGTSQSK